MRVLIAKLGAAGDVVRTTSLLHPFADAEITWITAGKNIILIDGVRHNLRCLSWEERELAADREYDLVVNVEDDLEVAKFLSTLGWKQWFGAYADRQDCLRYTEDSRSWFDMSLISSYGRCEADRLKLFNRRTYQDLIFEGLGFCFQGEEYVMPRPAETDLSGDIAIASEAGAIWPMKKWAYYDEIKVRLEKEGFSVNFLPHRSSILQHMADVWSHKCLLGGDSLPMHLGLGGRTRCISLFTCTSPWEIYDYGRLKKIVSPVLAQFFYKRGFDSRATTAIDVSEVMGAVLDAIRASPPQPLGVLGGDVGRFSVRSSAVEL